MRPDYYKLGDLECIDVVRHMPFLEGNIVKYLWRWRQKGGIKDLHKARTYLQFLIDEAEQNPPE